MVIYGNRGGLGWMASGLPLDGRILEWVRVGNKSWGVGQYGVGKWYCESGCVGLGCSGVFGITLERQDEVIGFMLRVTGFCLHRFDLSSLMSLGLRNSNGVCRGCLVTMILFDVYLLGMTTTESDCVRSGWGPQSLEILLMCCWQARVSARISSWCR